MRNILCLIGLHDFVNNGPTVEYATHGFIIDKKEYQSAIFQPIICLRCFERREKYVKHKQYPKELPI